MEMKNWFFRDGTVAWSRVLTAFFVVAAVVLMVFAGFKLRHLERISGSETESAQGRAIRDSPPEPPDAPLRGPASTEPEPFPDSGELEIPAPSGPPDDSEIPEAVFVEGNPLVVELPWYLELGEISVEQFDEQGNPTKLVGLYEDGRKDESPRDSQ